MSQRPGSARSAKVVVIGNQSVGKTSLIARLRGDPFMASGSTIGATMHSVTLEGTAGHVPVVVWDTAGEERFRALIPLYLRGARLALVCFSLCDKGSFDDIAHWVDILHTMADLRILIALVGCKSDGTLQISREMIDNVSLRVQASFFCVTSAKTGDGVVELRKAIADALRDVEATRNPVGVESAVALSTDAEDGTCC